MANKTTFRVSVRDLVAAAGRQQDLGRGSSSRIRAMEGIREHIRVQESWTEDWQKEVSISLNIEQSSFTLEIFGRMDGLLEASSGVIVQEIKTCRKNPEIMVQEPPFSHLEQLKCYGYMVAMQKDLHQIDLILTYVNVFDQETASKELRCTNEQLEDFFSKLISSYLSMLGSKTAWARIRNQSIQSLEFPYSDFRTGQRDLAESVYKVIKHDRILFARAPTGTGKTMATLFPAIKAIGQKETDKIFYLTAKSPGRTVAAKALKDLANAGARIKSVIITAKQKTCFTPQIPCDMETCIYARAYYTKLAKAMAKSSNQDHFDQECIERLAREFEICPFEFSLDLSLTCDIIICDLNYAFDPRVYLKRFFDRSTGKLTFLIDEAHNLPDRLRSMYSALISQNTVTEAQKLLRDTAPGLGRALTEIRKEMIRLKTAFLKDIDSYSCSELPESFMAAAEEFTLKADLWLEAHQESLVRDIVLETFFTINGFLNLSRYFGSHYRIFIQSQNLDDYLDIHINLFCLDPAPIFSRLIKRCTSAVFFSATFYPFEYYQHVLFGLSEPENIEDETEDDTQDNKEATPKNTKQILPHFIALPSPFPREHFTLTIHNRIKTTYRHRSQYYDHVADLIVHTVKTRPGNLLVFFSSYGYMDAVLDRINPDQFSGSIQIQHPGMDESQRLDFLENFTPKGRVTGFAVMGGIFGEGIDLKGSRLTTVMVVGVGLPQVNFEQEQIRAYYDSVTKKDQTNTTADGFFIAYQMPGFSRVLQAAGRLIRSDTDKGVVLLVDERFTRPDYQTLFPPEWQGFEVISNTEELDEILEKFKANENQ